MKMNPIILEKIKNNNNMITTVQVMELGFSRTILSKYVKAGLLERSRQGIYILSNSVHDDMYTLMMRSDKIIFSHDTTLFLNGLSKRTPFMHSVTIPSNTSLPNSLIDEETVISAVKNYAASPNKNLNRLAVYASMFKIDKELKRYM